MCLKSLEGHEVGQPGSKSYRVPHHPRLRMLPTSILNAQHHPGKAQKLLSGTLIMAHRHTVTLHTTIGRAALIGVIDEGKLADDVSSFPLEVLLLE